MSLYIDVDKVTGVLLADGWHLVADKSFDLDAYEYHREDYVLLEGGGESSVPATGARWYEGEITQTKFFCPLTAILAVRY